MARKYGLPYQGGKDRLAERIVELMPEARRLYDLFAGGCAVSHCALLSGKWDKVVANDITDSAIFFGDVLDGKYKGRNEWVSREDFFELKDSDPWVRIMFSFGNDQRTYLYGKHIEAYKESVHRMLTAQTVGERRRFFRKVVREIARLCNDGKARLAIDSEISERLESLERVQSLEHVQSLERVQGDYRNIEILPDSVIYCDIPYKGTKDYLFDFDHDAFYEWALRQTAPLFISEYDMPPEFECVAEYERKSTMSATNNRLSKTERIYRPKRQL